MIYRLRSGEGIDTRTQLNFEQRNFIQKLMIHHYLGEELEEFRARWRGPGNPVWTGPTCLRQPGPAVRIILDLEATIGRDKTGRS